MFRPSPRWMLRVTDRTLWVTVLLVLALVLVNAVLMQRNVGALFSGAAWMFRAHRMLSTLDRVETLLQQAEIDERSYLMTGDKLYSDAYGAIRPQIEQRLSDLEESVQEDAGQEAGVRQLRGLVDTRLRQIADAFAGAAPSGRNAPPAIPATALQQPLSEELALIEKLRQVEQERFAIRYDSSHGTYRTTVVSVIGGAMTGIFLVGLVGILIRQSITLRDSGRRFLRASLDALSSHIAVLDDKGTILEVNAAWRDSSRLQGLHSAAVEIGQNYVAGLERLLPVDPDAAVATRGIRDVLSGRRSQFTMRYPSDGREGRRWLQMQVTRFRDRTGPLRLVVAHEDLTAQVASELAMRRRSTQLQRLAEASSQIAAARDVDAVVVLMTASARTLVGGHWAFGVVQQDGRPQATSINTSDKFDSRRFAGAHLDTYEFARLLTKLATPIRRTQAQLEADGASQGLIGSPAGLPPLRGMVGVPLVGRSGERQGVLLVSDCTEGEFSDDDTAILSQLAQVVNVALENARLYEELRDADRRKDEFLATLSHELRNPLAPIRNSLRTMEVAGDPGQVSRSRAIIDRQVTQMVRLIDDLLDISRITRGKLELRLGRVVIQEAIQAAVEAMRPSIDRAGHELTLALPPEPVFVDGDDARLAQIFSNLLSNAAKYTPPEGRITVTAELREDEIVVGVHDTGLGIPREKLPGIFEMFSQIDQSVDRAQGGLGIGLALVKRLVEMHGGRVTASSEGLGRGSEFEVRLPVARSTAELPQRNAETPPAIPGKPRRVLVVDDNRDATESLVAFLRIAGHDVEGAYDGLEAIERTIQSQPDVVLLDIGLPKLNGYEAAQRIRTLSRGRIVLVAVTGWGQEPDRARARRAGFDRHLVKPVDPTSLLALIEELA